MIKLIRGSEIDVEYTYEAISKGFSDYIMPFTMSKEDFIKRIFGPEGNALEHSFVALDDDQAVGAIIGGIKKYEGVKTLRCGAMAITPAYRGSGLAQKLFEAHKQEGVENSCKQLFLEVIVGNDRAIRFYEKMGYEKAYDLYYYSLEDPKNHFSSVSVPEGVEFKTLEYDRFAQAVKSIEGVHVNWQNDLDYISQSEGMLMYGAYRDGKLCGHLCLQQSGSMKWIWVNPEHRAAGIGKALLYYAIQQQELAKLAASFPNNSHLLGFVKRLGFTRNTLSQYEMYLPI